MSPAPPALRGTKRWAQGTECGRRSTHFILYLPLVFEVWGSTSNISLKPQQLRASLSFKLNLKSSQSHSLKSQAIKKIYTTRPIKSEELAGLWLLFCSPVNHSKTRRKSNCSVFPAFFCLHFPTEVFQVVVDCFSQNVGNKELCMLAQRSWTRLVSCLDYVDGFQVLKATASCHPPRSLLRLSEYRLFCRVEILHPCLHFPVFSLVQRQLKLQ